MANIIENPSGEENKTESICHWIGGDEQQQAAVQVDRSDILNLSSSLYVQTIVSASLADFFVSFLPTDDVRLKAVFWQFEGAVLRICTIIESDDDFEFERSIYKAERSFLEKFPDVQSDFYLIFQQGRGLNELRPGDSHQAFPRQQ